MTTLANYQTIASRFAPQGQKGAKAREWYNLHKQRMENKQRHDPLPSRFGTFAARAFEKQRRYWIGVIASRRWETSIEEGSGAWRDARTTELDIIDRGNGLYLLGLDGWKKYTRSTSWHVSLRYLCGHDDNGAWAVRLPGTIETVEDAVAWTTPAEVHKAQAAGKRVLRQGDVWMVEARKDNLNALPRGHRFDPETRTLTHDGGHAALHVPFPAKAVTAKVVNPAHSRRRGRFD